MHDGRNVFMKIVPLGKRCFSHKKGTGSEWFVFSCRGDTYLRCRSTYWITQSEVNIDWLLHFQSTLPVPQLGPTPTEQTMLEVECYPCHWRGHQFPTHIFIQPLRYAYGRGYMRIWTAARSENRVHKLSSSWLKFTSTLLTQFILPSCTKSN